MNMMEEEARQLLITRGWIPTIRKRREQKYLYARKWGYKERYISSLTHLPKVTPDQVLKKLASGQ